MYQQNDPKAIENTRKWDAMEMVRRTVFLFAVLKTNHEYS